MTCTGTPSGVALSVLSPLNAPAGFSQEAAAVPQSVAGLRHALVDYAQAGGVSAHVLRDVGLAVSEAVTNAVLHAYPAGRGGLVTVRADVSHTRLAISISDSGRGMRPRVDSPGAGLGISIMTRVADRIDFAQLAATAPELRLIFNLPARHQAH